MAREPSGTAGSGTAGTKMLPNQRKMKRQQVRSDVLCKNGKASGLTRHFGQTEKENTMLLLVIAMGVPLFAVIGYALLSPSQPVPEGS
jgi:hypothetical protein